MPCDETGDERNVARKPSNFETKTKLSAALAAPNAAAS